MSLATFIETLQKEFPDAHLELTQDVRGMIDGLQRFDNVCGHVSTIAIENGRPHNSSRYAEHVRTLAAALDPATGIGEHVKNAALAGVALAGPVAAVLHHAAAPSHDVVTMAVDGVVHGVSIVEAGVTVCVSVVGTIAVRRAFAHFNGPLELEIASLIRRCNESAARAAALMNASSWADAVQELHRMETP